MVYDTQITIVFMGFKNQLSHHWGAPYLVVVTKKSSPSSLTSFVPVTTQVCLLCLRGGSRVFLSRFSFSFQHENHPSELVMEELQKLEAGRHFDESSHFAFLQDLTYFY